MKRLVVRPGTAFNYASKVVMDYSKIALMELDDRSLWVYLPGENISIPNETEKQREEAEEILKEFLEFKGS